MTSPQRYQVPLEKHRRNRTGRSWGSLIKTGPKLQRHRVWPGGDSPWRQMRSSPAVSQFPLTKKVSSCIVFEVIVREVGVARSWNSLKQRTMCLEKGPAGHFSCGANVTFHRWEDCHRPMHLHLPRQRRRCSWICRLKVSKSSQRLCTRREAR